MNILAIDSSATWGSVAVSNNGNICFVNYLNLSITHSERLMLQIDEALKKSELTLDDINLIAFSNGPGSFTGLRIGLATVKGLCTAKKIPLYTVNSLYALAYNIYGCGLDIIPFIDAKMNEVYTALYSDKMQEVIAPLTTEPLTFLEAIKSPAIIIGNGVAKYPDLITNPNIIKALPHQNFIIASSLIGIVINENIKREYDFEDISDIEPYYLRKSQAEMNFNKGKKRA